MLQNFTNHQLGGVPIPQKHWPTFAETLYRLHKEGLYIHADQLAEFMIVHGLPVDLQYVPSNLQEKARALNANYQGDMVRLSENSDDYFWYVSSSK